MRRPNVLSHELRTPLTVVRGAAELLLDESAGPLNPDQKRFIQTIAENSNQVIDMASDLLAEASLESDLFNLRLEWTESASWFASVSLSCAGYTTRPSAWTTTGRRCASKWIPA